MRDRFYVRSWSDIQEVATVKEQADQQPGSFFEFSHASWLQA